MINPTAAEMENSDVDLLVAGTAADVNMVEGEMNGVSEKDMVEAIPNYVKDFIKLERENNSSIIEIWTSELSRRTRNALIKGDRNFSPCDVCDVKGSLIGKTHADAWSKTN